MRLNTPVGKNVLDSLTHRYIVDDLQKAIEAEGYEVIPWPQGDDLLEVREKIRLSHDDLMGSSERMFAALQDKFTNALRQMLGQVPDGVANVSMTFHSFIYKHGCTEAELAICWAES
jgi:hypothetical protein